MLSIRCMCQKNCVSFAVSSAFVVGCLLRLMGALTHAYAVILRFQLMGHQWVLQVRVPKAIPVEPEVTDIPIADGDDGTIDI